MSALHNFSQLWHPSQMCSHCTHLWGGGISQTIVWSFQIYRLVYILRMKCSGKQNWLRGKSGRRPPWKVVLDVFHWSFQIHSLPYPICFPTQKWWVPLTSAFQLSSANGHRQVILALAGGQRWGSLSPDSGSLEVSCQSHNFYQKTLSR